MSDFFESEQDELHRKMVQELEEIRNTQMPFGKLAGRMIYDLPAEYLQWFANKGFPKGRLGQLLRIVYQMKADGGDGVFNGFRATNSRRQQGL